MKFSTYNPQVQLNNGGNASAQVSSNPLAYGDNGMGAGALAKGMQQVQAGIEQYNERQDKVTYIAAMNELDKIRYDSMYGEQGYLNKQLDAATGISDEYGKSMEKATAEVAKKFKFMTPAYKAAFMDSAYKANNEGYKTVNRYEYGQQQAYKQALDKDADNMAILRVQSNPGSLEAEIQRATLRATMDEDTKGATELRIKDKVGKLVGASISADILSKNYVGAEKTLGKYKDSLTPEQYQSYSTQIKKQQLATNVDDIAKGMANMNEAEAQEYIKNYRKNTSVAEQPEGTTWEKDDSVIIKGANANTIQGISAAAKTFNDMFGDKMYVTSVMDGQHETHKGESIDIANDQFKNEKDRQRFISAMEAQGVYVYDEYKNSSKNKTGDHLHLDFSGFNGNNEQPLSLEEQDAVYARYEMYKNRQKKIKGEQMTEFTTGLRQEFINKINDPNALQWADNLANQYRNDPDKFDAIQSLSSHYLGSKFKKGTALDSDAVSVLTKGLMNGNFKDPREGNENNLELEHVHFVNEALTRYGDSPAIRNKLEEMYADYRNGEKAFSKDVGKIAEAVLADKDIKLKVKTPVDKIMAKQYIERYAIDYINAHTVKGETPTDAEVIAACVEAKKKITPLKYKPEGSWLPFNQVVNIDDTMKSSVLVQQDADGHFNVTFKGKNGRGEPQHLTGEQLNTKLYGGTK